ncbi:MAG: signal peptidase II [Deltaproteobacteria bacterium]|nr:signal peptidase II [Deltaproteobacteria bacterium]MBN2670431.1 signal peptidase II [Deltaproteobacteria bacterium]
MTEKAKATLQNKPFIWAIVIFVAFTAADQGSKYWAHHTLLADSFHEQTGDYPTCSTPDDEIRRGRFVYRNATPITVIENFWSFRYVENCSNAFSLMKNVPESFRFPFLLIISLLACVVIPYMYLKTPAQHVFTLYALPFIWSGALGNLLDRMIYRYVIDFVDWYVVMDGKEHHWPTFNVADVSIVVGIGLMALQVIKGARDEKAQKTSASTKSA